VFTLRNESRAFTPAASRVAAAAVAVVANWLSGVFLRRINVRTPAAERSPLDLVRRLQGEVDRSGRLRIGGAVAIVTIDPARTGTALDDVLRIVHDLVRPSDIIGTVGTTGAGVLLRDARGDAVKMIVERLRRANGLTGVRVAVATFDPGSEYPETLLQRALSGAPHRQGLS
jgi:hypothetical protein